MKSSSLFCWGSASAEAADFPPPSCLSSSLFFVPLFFFFSSHLKPRTLWTLAPWKVAGGSTQGVKTSTSSPSSRRPLIRLEKRILIPETCEKGDGSVLLIFFLRGRAVRGRILPLRPSTLSLFSSENFSQQRPLCSLTDKDGDLPGRGGELGGGLDGRRGLGVEGDGLRSFFCLEKNKRA